MPTCPVCRPISAERSPNLASVGMVLSMYGLLSVLLRMPLGILTDATGRYKTSGRRDPHGGNRRRSHGPRHIARHAGFRPRAHRRGRRRVGTHDGRFCRLLPSRTDDFRDFPPLIRLIPRANDRNQPYGVSECWAATAYRSLRQRLSRSPLPSLWYASGFPKGASSIAAASRLDRFSRFFDGATSWFPPSRMPSVSSGFGPSRSDSCPCWHGEWARARSRRA